MKDEELKEATEKLIGAIADDGSLVKVGWAAYERYMVPKTACDGQRRDTRIAFYAGAQHLFSSMIHMLEQGEEPTEKDNQRMQSVFDELNEFEKELKARLAELKGEAS